MRVLELFAGTRSISRAFERSNEREREREREKHFTYSIEWDKGFEKISLYADISKVTAKDIIEQFGKPDIIWASPDCTTYSIAGISHHRKQDIDGNLIPTSEYAKFCDIVNNHVIELINELNPMFWFIENPRGGMRKMNFIKLMPRYTVTYCQYGDNRMKPTDIWTNHPCPKFKQPCKNGDPCHVAAPRGSRTGTQGLKGHVERSKIPDLLCDHIVEICEEGLCYLNYFKSRNDLFQ